MNFKNIHIGELIEGIVKESQMDIKRICKFLDTDEDEVKNMYLRDSLETNILLKWSKLLSYDFFRFYSQHLILYSPQVKTREMKSGTKAHLFRKNIYTREIIDFILEEINTKVKTPKQVVDDYNIPKTTLYKWMSKYN